MSKLSLSLFSATMGLSLAAVFADAQPAAKPAAPASTESTAAPGASPAAHECPRCAHPSGSAPATSAAGEGATMRGKPGMMQHGMMMQHAAKPEHHARLHEVATLADIKVQPTKFGAVIQLVAKKAADAARVQELAKELATHWSAPREHAQAPHARAH